MQTTTAHYVPQSMIWSASLVTKNVWLTEPKLVWSQRPGRTRQSFQIFQHMRKRGQPSFLDVILVQHIMTSATEDRAIRVVQIPSDNIYYRLLHLSELAFKTLSNTSREVEHL